MKDNKKIDAFSPQWIDLVKRLTIKAMFSDVALMERLVLKGGNAVDLIHGAASRASMDLDFSMADDFADDEKSGLAKKIERELQATFAEEGLTVFDVEFAEKPEHVSEELKAFWGGYGLAFKIISASRYLELTGDTAQMRREALMVGGRGKVEVDFSKYEYCEGKEARDLEGYRIYVYTPEMVVAEKLRALCQQMEEYGPVVKRTRRGAARARDFVDIHGLVTKFAIEPEAIVELVGKVFAAKRVPLELLKKLPAYRTVHAADFRQVEETRKEGVQLESFDFYFDFVMAFSMGLESARDV